MGLTKDVFDGFNRRNKKNLLNHDFLSANCRLSLADFPSQFPCSRTRRSISSGGTRSKALFVFRIALEEKKTKRFATMAQSEVPQGRNGKHKSIVSKILRELDQLEDAQALIIPIAELSDSKENVRSALNRASHKLKRPLKTSADAKFLYVWSSNN